MDTVKLRQYLRMPVGEFEATAPSTGFLFAEEQDITFDGDSSKKKNVFAFSAGMHGSIDFIWF